MKKRSFYVTAIIFIFAVAIAVVFSLCTQPETKTPPTVTPGEKLEKLTLRWGSSKEGTAGYAIFFGVAKIISEKVPELYIEAVPTAGSIASQRMYAKGELDGCYAGLWNLVDVYQNRGPYEKEPWPKDRPKPYHTWYVYTADSFVVTRADRDDIQSWEDLRGKKVYIPIPGSAVYEVPKAAFKAAGIWDDIEVVDIPFSAVPDALRSGTIDAAVPYVISHSSPAPWVKELATRADIKVVNPTQEQIDAIKKAKIKGMSTSWVSTKETFPEKDVGTDKIFMVSTYYGFHTGKNVPSEYIYRMVKTLIENAEEVSKTHAVAKLYAKDPLKLQIEAIDSAPDIPVHPGTAKYLKERGVWKDEWKIGEE